MSSSLSGRPLGAYSHHQSLLALSEWQEKERGASLRGAVDEQGLLLDSLTLELRCHPPEIGVDNVASRSTVVTIDSANRPGSLIFVVQHFTELGLRINSARISSDGGWFHDTFHICEVNGDKVRNPKKIQSMKQMLNVYMQDEELVANGDETDDMNKVETTVFQLSGLDRPGLLADVTHLLTHNGCNVRSAAVWTYKGRVAFVLSVTEKGKPVDDDIKLDRLRQLVTDIMLSRGDTTTVRIDKVRGEVHHDRRLHQLMLQEELEEWERQNAGPPRPASPDTVEAAAVAASAVGPGPRPAPRGEASAAVDTSHARPSSASDMDDSGSSSSGSGGGSSPSDSAMSVHASDGGCNGGGKAAGASPYRSPKFDRPIIEITHCSHPDYWTVSIRCRDRTKLVFDTVCTLADMDYDIYHGTVDCADGVAHQEYFVRPRSGDGEFSGGRAALLKAMLAQSIERRFPKGLKVHVRSHDRFGCLAALARQLQQAGLSVTRAKVRTFATSRSSGHTLYVMDAAGGPPDRARVQAACQAIGGQLVESEDLVEGKNLPSDPHNFSFSFSFLNRQWNENWGGSLVDGFSFGSL